MFETVRFDSVCQHSQHGLDIIIQDGCSILKQCISHDISLKFTVHNFGTDECLKIDSYASNFSSCPP